MDEEEKSIRIIWKGAGCGIEKVVET